MWGRVSTKSRHGDAQFSAINKVLGQSPAHYLPESRASVTFTLSNLSICGGEGISMARGLFPPLMAAIIGIGTGKCNPPQPQVQLLRKDAGIYTFQPVWQEYQQRDREQRIKRAADVGPNMVEVPVQQMSNRESKKDSHDQGNDKRS